VEYRLVEPLPNWSGPVRVRFAPNPDGAITLGNARPAVLCEAFKRKYGGSYLLRYEDTSPSVKPPIPEAYKWILEDLNWLGIHPDEIYYQSDRLEIYYNYAKKLLELGHGYICTCDREHFRELVKFGVPCPHRDQSPEKNLELWEKMLNGEFDVGEAVFRVKTDLKHPNVSVRDWPALRIDKAPHPRTGRRYVVWPLYNWSCAIDDHLMRITHVIRGKEHIANELRQTYLFNYFNWKPPEAIHVGRIKLEGLILSKSKIREGLQKGEYLNWDDPRLGTIRSLRRRGFHPQTIVNVLLELGTKPVEASLDWKNIESLNRSLIDSKANRFFFVPEPIEVHIMLERDMEVNLPLHPTFRDRGYKTYKLNSGEKIFFLSSRDQRFLLNGECRLMGLFNIAPLKKVDSYFVSNPVERDVKSSKKLRIPFIQWVLKDYFIEVEVIMPDASITRGYCEKHITKFAGRGDVVQFVRFGFIKIDDVSTNLVRAFFTHR